MTLLAGCMEAAAEENPAQDLRLDVLLARVDSPEDNFEFTFNQPVLQEKDGEQVFPEVVFTPPLDGTFLWQSDQELIFEPAEGQFAWGNRIVVEVKPYTPVAGAEWASTARSFTVNLPRFRAGNKVANWESVPGKPRFLSNLGHQRHSGEIGHGGYYLLYDQPVDPSIIAEYVSLNRLNGEAIPVSVAHGEKIQERFGVEADSNYIAVVTPNRQLSQNSQYMLSIPSWSQKEMDTPELLQVGLSPNYEFTLQQMTISSELDNGRYDPEPTLVLRFKNQFHMEHLESVLEIEPEPKSTAIRYNWHNYSPSVTVYLSLDIGQEYSVTIADGSLEDYLGNPFPGLNEEIHVRDHYPDMEVPVTALTVETEREQIPVQLLNVDSVQAKLFEFDSATDYIQALESSRKNSAAAYGFENALEENRFDLSSEYSLNNNFTTSIDMNAYAGSGFKLIELTAFGTGSEAERRDQQQNSVLYHSTDIGLMAKVHNYGILVWTSSFSKAESYSDVSLTLYDHRGRELGTAVTDELGLAHIETSLVNATGVQQRMYIVGEKNGMQALLKLDNSEMSSPWQFNLPSVVDESVPMYGSVFTERGVYRPEDTVFIKSFVEPSSFVANTNYHIRVMDPRGKYLMDQQLVPDDYNAADFALELPPGAAVGRYDVMVSNGSSSISADFLVEEYRVPAFLVNVVSASGAWEPGETATVNIDAKYYAGGDLANREVKWNVYRWQAPLHVADFPDYIFQTAETLNSDGPYISREGMLNSAGELSVSFRPDESPELGRLQYTFEAVVQDVDRQSYSARVSRIVDPADFYIGVRPPARAVMSSQSPLDIPVITVDPSGKTIAGKDISIKVEIMSSHSSARQFNRNQVQILNRQVGRTVATHNLTTGETAETWRFNPEQAGVYRFTFESPGSSARASFYQTITGDEQTAWPRFDIERIDVTRDKEQYNIGDVAVLVPQIPYDEATVLMTLERDGIMQSRIFTVSKNTPGIEVEVTEEMTPNVYASFAVIRGRVHNRRDATGYETGAPGFKLGYANIVVEPDDKKLDVQMDLPRQTVAPGESVTLPISVTDNTNQGVPSQLTVMVVDQAVLDMTNYQTPDPLSDILVPRPLGVKTSASWLDLPHSRRKRLEQLFPGGADELGAANRSDLEKILRNLFKSTAYWNPTVTTDAQGNANVQFTMPDNLTTYRIMVIAADGKSRYGSMESSIQSQLPLMVQPVLPRFVYPDDSFTIEALVINNSPERGNVAVDLEVEGLDISRADKHQTITLDSGASGTVQFPVSVLYGDEIKVRYHAVMGNNEDAAEFTVPILNVGTRISEIFSTRLTENSVVEGTFSSDFIPGTMEIEATVSKTVLTELQGSVQYLMKYPHGCIEQTTSRAYPLLVLKDLLPLIGVEVDQAELKSMADAGVQRILSFQTISGGLCYRIWLKRSA